MGLVGDRIDELKRTENKPGKKTLKDFYSAEKDGQVLRFDDEKLTFSDIIWICEKLDKPLFDFFDSKMFMETVDEMPYVKTFDMGNPLFSDRVHERFDVYSYDHAAEILKTCYSNSFESLGRVLENYFISIDDVLLAGGNESEIPRSFGNLLIPEGWSDEQKITGDLRIRVDRNHGEKQTYVVQDYIDGYKVDYFKERVALDVEWNSKDQTYDRDLSAMRAYYESGLIGMGIIITRAADLKELPAHYRQAKYGASTTWMGKLLPRLKSRKAGGCPILAIGIKPEAIAGIVMDEADFNEQ